MPDGQLSARKSSFEFLLLICILALSEFLVNSTSPLDASSFSTYLAAHHGRRQHPQPLHRRNASEPAAATLVRNGSAPGDALELTA